MCRNAWCCARMGVDTPVSPGMASIFAPNLLLFLGLLNDPCCSAVWVPLCMPHPVPTQTHFDDVGRRCVSYEHASADWGDCIFQSTCVRCVHTVVVPARTRCSFEPCIAGYTPLSLTAVECFGPLTRTLSCRFPPPCCSESPQSCREGAQGASRGGAVSGRGQAIGHRCSEPLLGFCIPGREFPAPSSCNTSASSVGKLPLRAGAVRSSILLRCSRCRRIEAMLQVL